MGEQCESGRRRRVGDGGDGEGVVEVGSFGGVEECLEAGTHLGTVQLLSQRQTQPQRASGVRRGVARGGGWYCWY